ncbi:hypothetical protein BDF14DRAFT_1751991 [Spinellus fusiger]|nr:hypothetical protein BDF14DRAFT_1751991 [Spinellus fusiger]
MVPSVPLSLERSHPTSLSLSLSVQVQKHNENINHERRTRSGCYSKREAEDTLEDTLSLQSTHYQPKRHTMERFSYQVGDQVEAVKWEEERRLWYGARIVEIIFSRSRHPCFFVHFEGWPVDQADWVDEEDIQPPHLQMQYGPLGKESHESWKDYSEFHDDHAKGPCLTGLVHDTRMSLHDCPCHGDRGVHPEQPLRITSILETLHSQRLLRYFRRVQAREITQAELLRVHTFAHVYNYFSSHTNKITSIAALLNPITTTELETTDENSSSSKRNPQRRHFPLMASNSVTPPDLIYKMSCGELGIAIDTTFHPHHSSYSARVSAGALIELSNQVVEGHLQNGFALIRPPGHHAEEDAAMGYCFFNNVAVAVASILETHASTIRKVLILDCHGNGTQKIFYDNPNVLYISVHRWDQGTFYPYSGTPEECGEGSGLGRNVNIALSASEERPKPMGDTEFMAAFYHIILPITRQFKPDMIFVSAGYDAAEGHPEHLGGYKVTPRGFALMTKMINDLAKELCHGRLVLTLEGGYALQPLADSASATIKPNQGAFQSLRQVVEIQKKYWDLPDYLFKLSFKFHLPATWRATHSIANRPRRVKASKPEVVSGY